jgi:rod shape determining protein RodA
MVVIGLYLFLLLRLIFLAERQRSVFSRVFGYSVAAVFFMHVFINIGMAIGIVPVIGIPLPFFSYGGSSLWGFTLLIFVFLRLDASRNEYLI